MNNITNLGKLFNSRIRNIILLGFIFITALFINYLIYIKETKWIFILGFLAVTIIFFLKLKPDYFLFAFVFFLPVFLVGVIRIERLDIYPSQTLVFVAAIFWFFNKIVKDKEVKLSRTPIDLPLIIFLLINILSIYQSHIIPISYPEFVYPGMRNKPFIKSISQLLWMSPGILSYYVIVNFLRKKELIINTLKVWIFSTFFVSLFGLYQFIGYYLKLPFANYFAFTWNIVGPLRIVRVQSLSLEPHFLATYIICILPLAISLFVFRINLIKRKWLLLIILVSGICFFLTFSRTSILISISVCFSLIYLMRYRNPKLFKKLLIITIFIILVSTIFLHRQFYNKVKFLLDTSDYSNHITAFQRVVCWKSAFNMFLKHPLLGVGVGNFAFHFMENLPSPDIKELMTHTDMPRIVNNIYFETLAETGLFGFFAFIWILYSLIRGPLKKIKYTEDRSQVIIISGLLLSFIGVLVAHSVSSAFYFPYVWALMGLLTAMDNLTKNYYG